MREIKFRGKKIDSNEWIFGWLRQSGQQEIQKANGQYVRTEKYYQIQNNKYHFEFVTEETIGQYTGLKDKNGTEIYEGDIFEVINSHEERFIVWVEYSEKYAEFVIRHSSNIVIDNEPLGDIDTAKTVIILGNIHDNPQLLEE